MERIKPRGLLPTSFNLIEGKDRPKFGSGLDSVPVDPSTFINDEKNRRGTRIQKTLFASLHNYDRSRKTPDQRIAIQRTRALRDVPLPDSRIIGTAFFTGSEPSYMAPVSMCHGIDPQACCQRMLGTGNPIRMDLRDENQLKHHKERYDEESHP